MNSLMPAEIVAELDRFIIGQSDAKRAVAVALRNRWRRMQLPEDIRDEVVPKNILMIGPTGVGKTEIARRVAKIAGAPFIKVEATKFTEVGYVGRDVEQIIRDLVEMAMTSTREQHRNNVIIRAEDKAKERILDVLTGENASDATRQSFKEKLEQGLLDDKEIELEVNESAAVAMPTMDVPGMPGAQMGMLNLSDILGKTFGKSVKRRKLSVAAGLKILIDEETEALIDQDKTSQEALQNVQQNGIVFIDEIDKICARNNRNSADVSREGVQRDLLPLIEGTTVITKHGAVKTDHILFIASGAFHVAKPADLLPELQGRLPIRVELKALTKHDFERILMEPEASLIKQCQALLKTEGVELVFEQPSIIEIASLAADINSNVENIGARRLHTVLEKLLEEISFNAHSYADKTVSITADLVRDRLAELAKNVDVSKFIL